MPSRVFFVGLVLLTSIGLTSAQETARLHKLCELWGGIKYFHPKLAYTDIDWDKALVSAIPDVRAAKTSTEYRAAVAKMLNVLGDPNSTILTPTAGDAGKPRPNTEKFRIEKDILILNLGASLDTVFSNDYTKFTEDLKKALSSSNGLVIDVRSRRLSPLNRFRNRNAFWTYINLGLSGLVTEATSRTRQHLGFVPVNGTTSGGYVSSLNSQIPGVVNGSQPKTKPFVVVIDSATSPEIFPLIVGAQAVGQCAVVAESSSAMDSISDRTTFDMGEGVQVAFPVSEVVSSDGHLGFQADKLVPYAENQDNALAAALELAQKPIKKRAPGKDGLLPPRPLLERAYADMVYPNTEYRLLALFRYWNVIRYFFPYLDLIGKDWGDVLDEFIPRFISASNDKEYGRVVSNLAAQLNDRHATVTGPQVNYLYDGVPALRTRYLDGKFIVGSLNEALKVQGIAQGDELVEVDGMTPSARVEEQAKFISFSRPINAFYIFGPVAGPKGSVGKFKIKGADGTIREFEITRNNEAPTIVFPRPPQLPPYGVLPSGYGYIDLTRVQTPDIQPSMAALKDTPGLIFDMRGYPNATGWGYGSQLTSKRVPIARFLKPDAEIWSPTTGNPNGRLFVDHIDAAPGDKYKGKVVVLINYQAVSQSEHTCLILKAARPDTVFIGQTTIGANGDVTNIVLPGGLSMAFSGQAVTWVDGKQLQRVGVIPDIPVEPTAKGILASKDEILEAAIAYLDKK